MKKLVLSLAILGFVAFGALSVQNLIASAPIEVVNFDKDPKKDTKKVAETKEVKGETTEVKGEVKANESNAKDCSKDCSSSCNDKSASDKSCCDKSKAGCCSSGPDKK